MKKKHYVMLGVLLVLIITNPSATAFKLYKGHDTSVKRPLNLFICSIYINRGEYYLGILGNFIQLTYRTDLNGFNN